MKSLLLIFLCAAFFFLQPTLPVYAAHAGTARTGGHASAPAAGTFRLSIPEDESLEIERVLSAVIKDLGFTPEPTHNLRRTAASEADSGDADMVGLYPANIDRIYTNLVRVPYALSNSTFRAYNRDVHTATYSGWSSLAGLKVGFLPQNIYIPLRVPGSAEVRLYDSETELWAGLGSGEVDVVVLPEFETVPRTTPRGFRIAGTLEYADTYAYVNVKNAGLVDALVEAFQRLEDNGTIDAIKRGEKPNVLSRMRVLHITSYSLDALWEAQVTEGIREGLQLKDNETIDTFQLNTRHIQDKFTQRRNTALSIRNTFLDGHPDVIIVSDNDALEFTAQYYHTLFTNVPVIFCGVNNFHEDMVANIKNLAIGCTESISAISTIEEMLRLYPQTERIFILNDYVTSGRMWREDIERQIARTNPAVEIVYNENIPHDEIIKQIEGYGTETLVLLGSYFVDSLNQFWAEDETQGRVAAASENPVFSLISSFTGAGALGGRVSSGFNQGEYAGSLARQILDGTPASALTTYLATETINEWIFDADVIRQYGISENALPEDVRYLNRVRPIWEIAPAASLYALVALAFFVLVIIVLILIIRRAYGKANEYQSMMIEIAENPVENSMINTMEWLSNVLHATSILFVVVLNDKIAVLNNFTREHLKIAVGDPVRALFKANEMHTGILRRLTADETVANETIPITLPNGETHRHRATFTTAKQDDRYGYLMLARDIEKEELSQEYINRTNSDLQRIIDTLPMSMAVINSATNKLEYANSQFLVLLECDSVASAPEQQTAQIARQIFARWQGTSVRFEYVNNYIRVNNLTIRLHASQIVFRGQNCFVIIGQDISAETRHADILARAAEKEREANQLKSLFLANMSHEIRTPMNAILGLSQTSLMKDQTPENANIYKKIGSAARTLLSIINDILDFSKIEAEKMDIVEEDFILEETIANVFLVAIEHAEDKPLEILLDAATDVPAVLCGDKSRLWQILKNLLDNSVKYTQKGHVILSIAVTDAREDAVNLRFRITDTGVGMTEEQVNKLFTPFEQFHRNVTKAAGTGLGMSITKNLIHLLNGTITVSSEANVGTVFEVELPFKRAANASTITEHALKSLAVKPDTSRPVLIVDDNPFAYKSMSRVLNNIGIETEWVSRLADVGKNGRPYQIIIGDYYFDGSVEHGKEAVTRVNECYTGFKLFLSASTRWRTALGDRNDVVEKPFTVSDFLGKLFGGLDHSEGMIAAPEQVLSFPNARVLLVEDNEINQLVVTSILENFDVVPEIANHGQEALDILERQTFDVVYMDISMPVMDGHTATAKIRHSDKPYKNVPIVAMTANVMPDEVTRYIEEGMNGFLEKPIDIEAFQASLVKFLS